MALLLFALLPSLRAKEEEEAVEEPEEGDEAESTGGHDNDCSDAGENCIESGCCKNSSLTCFMKTEQWGTCLESCTPGLHEEDGEDNQEWWHCATAENLGCSKENENCDDTGCCFDPGMKCYKKNGNFSSCKTSCEPGIHEDDAEEWRTPWDCSEVVPTCADAYQQCGGKGWTGPTCCNEGCSCERTSAFYHQCARTDVEPGLNDGSANTCNGEPAPAPPTRPPSKASHKKEEHKSKQHDSAKTNKKHESKHTKESKGDEDVTVVEDEDEDGWYDDMDLAQQLPNGAAAVPSAQRRRGVLGWIPAVACGTLLASAVVVVIKRRSGAGILPNDLQAVSDRPAESDTTAE